MTLALLLTAVTGAWADGIVCTASDLGKVLCTDGSIYENVSAATTAGKEAAAMIAYVDETNKNGLALALTDEEGQTWDNSSPSNKGKTAPEICSALNTSKAVTGGTWKLPSQDEWKQMFSANGGKEGSYTGLKTAIGNAGGTALMENEDYWSSSEVDEWDAWLVNLSDGNASWSDYGKHYSRCIRACLAFDIAAPSIEVTPVTGKTNQWTFTMPANDVVLTPIYSAATIYSGQTETPFETLKEAFAAVKDGDVIKLDWNVTLTETVETLLRNGAINFTLDLNGYIIDGMTPEYAIRLRNGDYMTITDSSLGQTGGLKCQELVGEQYAKFIFDGGRYTMGQLTADFLNTVCSKAAAALLLASGKEFTDIENAPDADGFTVRVGFKTFDLAIDSKRFATFYNDMNIKFAEKPAEGVGLYTISSIDAGRSTATVTPISGIIPANTPMLVYNGTEQKQTAKLIVTLDNAQDAVDWAPQFMGTATKKDFTAADMEAADYYALSGGKAFAPVKGAGTLGANQCWLQFDKQEIPSARQFTLVFDSEATGIKTTDCTDYTDSVWYDLNGRKVAAPSKKGIYIMNGRKVVVK